MRLIIKSSIRVSYLFYYSIMTCHVVIVRLNSFEVKCLGVLIIFNIFKGKSPFAPDREHFHHIFLVAGYSTKQSVWIMIGLSALLSTIRLIGYYSQLPEALMFVGMLSLFGLYFWGMSHAWKVMKAIRIDNKGSSASGSVDTP